ncbi:MAG: lasso peptide biosynthesis B2 protein [Rhodobacteraceae bacterium]|nr:lasso peptide biosynthesis B2 protein [Paracoccaceae bacterium]
MDFPAPDGTLLAWCEIDGQAIFLDIAGDRYFRLDGQDNRAFLDQAVGPGRERWHQPDALPRPPDWQAPRRTCPDMQQGPFRLADVAQAMWMQRRVERRLASHPLANVLFDTHRLLRPRAVACEQAQARMVRAFEYARLLRTAADRCLPRSLALALCLAARDVPAHVVIGVKLAPFAAHCWVQRGDMVLGDTAEEALRYTPILVL